MQSWLEGKNKKDVSEGHSKIQSSNSATILENKNLSNVQSELTKLKTLIIPELNNQEREIKSL